MAASTGGPAALQAVLSALPAGFPVPVLVVQHMPAGFTVPLARRLDQFCVLQVGEGREGEEVRPGQVWIAPAGKQMQLERAGERVYLRITSTSPVPTVLYPAADVLFTSMAAVYGAGSLAVVLTGMGRDGVQGLRRIKEAGGLVLAQDEKSSVVFGMPRAAIEASLVDAVVPLSAMAQEISKLVGPGYGA